MISPICSFVDFQLFVKRKISKHMAKVIIVYTLMVKYLLLDRKSFFFFEDLSIIFISYHVNIHMWIVHGNMMPVKRLLDFFHKCVITIPV